MYMIFVYWGILIVSYFIASQLRSYADKFRFLGTAMMGAIYILVFTMGLRMGINERVTSGLGTIGLQALILTFLTVAGSVLAVFGARKLLRIDRYGNLYRKQANETLSGDDRQDEKETAFCDHTSEPDSEAENGSSIDLKSTLMIIGLVALGVILGKVLVADHLPQHLEGFSSFTGNALTVFLCVLIAIIGFDLGMSGTVAQNLKLAGWRVLVFPLAITLGTMVTGIFTGMFFGFSLKESAAIAAGFGWYSYAPAVIAAAGPQFAVASAVSFLHNVIRETAGIILIPIFAKKIGYLEALGIPGIGTMDVCMPMIEKSCRQDTVVYGFISGFLICIFTSVCVPLFMSM